MSCKLLSLSGHDLQQFCQTQANAEIEELLQGIKKRFSLLKVPEPQIVVADNCCHVRKAIKNAFPNAHIGLDVWHMLMRYVTLPIVHILRRH